MTVPWRTTLRAVEVASGGATPPHQVIGEVLRDELVFIGRLYDHLFPEVTAGPPPVLNRPTTRVRSAEHQAWETTMTATLTGLDEVAQYFDGGGATSLEGDKNAAAAAVQARLTAALGLPLLDHEKAVVSAALTVALPEEPLYYAAEYYGEPISSGRHFTAGTLEDALDAAIAAVNEWLAIV